jgi:homocysteine S-methyltransferase
LIDAAMPLFNGIYIMTPMNFYDMSVQLTRYVREKSGR